MRLLQRYTAALMIGVLTVLAAYAYLHTRALRDFAHATLTDGHRSMASALAKSIVEIWRIDGEARALALVHNVAMTESGVGVRWVWVDDIASDLYKPAAPIELLREVLARDGELVWQKQNDDGSTSLVTYVPVEVSSSLYGALELTQSLTALEDELERGTIAIVLAVLGILVVAGSLALVLGIFMLGRPVQALTQFAERVGQGDFSQTLEVKRKDELSALSRAMNGMSRELRAAIDARIAAIERLRHADRLATVGKLAAGLAHELGTPLNTIGLHARSLETGEVEASRIAKVGRTVREQGERMARIVRQLLDFSRPKPLDKTRVEIIALMRRTLELLTPLAKQAGVELVLEKPTMERLELEADAMQLEQVLTNLMVNAIQAMPNGGVIRQSVVTAYAAHGSEGTRRFAKIEVADQGTGIDPNHLPHVFDPFFTTKDVGQGTGLGLAVSFGIIREHRGFIDVQSQLGQGTVFSVYLPLGSVSGPIEVA